MKYSRKQGHLVDECYRLKNKKEKDEKNKQPQKPNEASIFDFESNGDVLDATTTDNRCVIDWVCY